MGNCLDWLAEGDPTFIVHRLSVIVKKGWVIKKPRITTGF
jgi:hypothetical protein